jgi:hypothetical protein
VRLSLKIRYAGRIDEEEQEDLEDEMNMIWRTK